MAARLARILITTDFYAPHAGGVGRYVETLVSFFPEHEITVLTHRLPGTSAKEQHGNVTVVRFAEKAILGSTFFIPLSTLPRLQPHDLVITNTRFCSSTLMGMRLARKWKAHRIHVEHGNQHVPHNNVIVRFIAWVYDETIGRIVMLSADKVVCVSRKGLEFTRSLSAKAPLCIPNAIDPSLFKPSPALRAKARSKYNIPKKAHVIVFVGRLVREKGIEDLIEAMVGLGYVLLVVGDGQLRAELESLCEKRGVESRFIGSQNQKGVHEALCAADLFVNPSWAEGLPTSILEALAARLPVIATDVGGTGELLPKHSLVPSRNPELLRKALSRHQTRMEFPRRYTTIAAGRLWRTLAKEVLR